MVPLGVALLARGPTVGGEFVADDRTDVLGHPVVTGRAPLTDLLIYNHHGQPFGEGQNLLRPLSTFLFSLEYRMVGASSLPFHLVSVALYLVLVWLAFRVIRLFFPRKQAVWVACLFAALALHTEPVAAVAYRSELLALVFGLGAVLAQARGRVVVTALLYAGALASKESAVLLPLTLAWVVVARQGPAAPFRRTNMLLFGALGALALSYLVFRLQLGPLRGNVVLPDNLLAAAPFSTRLWAAAGLLGHYLTLCVGPVALASDYTYAVFSPLPGPADPHTWLGLLFAVAIVAAALTGALRRRSDREPADAAHHHEDRPPYHPVAPSVAAGGFVVTFALTSNLVIPLTIIFAERLFLAPSFWLVLVVAAAVARLVDRRPQWVRPAQVATAGVIALQLWLSVNGALAWRDEVTLGEAQTAARPSSVKGHMLYARALARADRPRPALVHLALAARGRAAFPGPWRPPGWATDPAAPVQQRLKRLVRSLAPNAPFPAAVARFRVLAVATFGRPYGAMVDRFAASWGLRRASSNPHR